MPTKSNNKSVGELVAKRSGYRFKGKADVRQAFYSYYSKIIQDESDLTTFDEEGRMIFRGEEILSEALDSFLSEHKLKKDWQDDLKRWSRSTKKLDTEKEILKLREQGGTASLVSESFANFVADERHMRALKLKALIKKLTDSEELHLSVRASINKMIDIFNVENPLDKSNYGDKKLTTLQQLHSTFIHRVNEYEKLLQEISKIKLQLSSSEESDDNRGALNAIDGEVQKGCALIKEYHEQVLYIINTFKGWLPENQGREELLSIQDVLALRQKKLDKAKDSKLKAVEEKREEEALAKAKFCKDLQDKVQSLKESHKRQGIENAKTGQPDSIPSMLDLLSKKEEGSKVSLSRAKSKLDSSDKKELINLALDCLKVYGLDPREASYSQAQTLAAGKLLEFVHECNAHFYNQIQKELKSLCDTRQINDPNYLDAAETAIVRIIDERQKSILDFILQNHKNISFDLALASLSNASTSGYKFLTMFMTLKEPLKQQAQESKERQQEARKVAEEEKLERQLLEEHRSREAARKEAAAAEVDPFDDKSKLRFRDGILELLDDTMLDIIERINQGDQVRYEEVRNLFDVLRQDGKITSDSLGHTQYYVPDIYEGISKSNLVLVSAHGHVNSRTANGVIQQPNTKSQLKSACIEAGLTPDMVEAVRQNHKLDSPKLKP